MIRIKRTYESPARGDGRRFLVERLWPRGMTKDALAADAWLKDIAPSAELRRWFDHRVDRWDEFRRRYQAELDANASAWEPLLEAGKTGTVTLLYSAKDSAHNSAVVLRDYLQRRAGHGGAVPRRQRRPPARATAAKRPSATGDTHGKARKRSR